MNATEPTYEPENPFYLALLGSVFILLLNSGVAGLLFFRHDPETMTTWANGLHAWGRIGILAVLFAYLAGTLDVFGRLCAGIAIRIWKTGDDPRRRSARFRFVLLAVFVGGMAIWKALDHERFPQAPSWWAYPYLLGAALVPVAFALRTLCRARRTIPAGGGK
jgi:hypothetical protein